MLYLPHDAACSGSMNDEIDMEVGVRLGPALFVFHLQLIMRYWFVDQTRTGQSVIIPATDFGYCIKAFELQHNLSCLPLVLYVRPSSPYEPYRFRCIVQTPLNRLPM
jgi:hypothetical protein